MKDILRPKDFNDFVGQEHLVGKHSTLRKLIEAGKIHSMIFWGPPGTGKTTLARIIANYTDAEFISYSAVTGGIAEVRDIIKEAKIRKIDENKETILFVDEIHRFNKAQQDAFLPVVEDGTITLIGATTENPGFEVNAPLLSRAQLYVFKLLSDEHIAGVIKNASNILEIKINNDAISDITRISSGDARKATELLKVLKSIAEAKKIKKITRHEVELASLKKLPQYDKTGDSHYDTISAFIKSMRGSDPDATLHYLARMLEAGEDPIFIARRMVIFASEDIGNAKPAALMLATSTMQACKMIGMPEAQIMLAQCATFLATSRKSVASYFGLLNALADIKNESIPGIPNHLKNEKNSVAKDLQFGKGYVRYPWHGEFKGKKSLPYLPQAFKDRKYYNFDEDTQDV